MTAANPYAMPTATAPAAPIANPYASPTPATAPANPYAATAPAPAPVAAPTPYTPPAPATAPAPQFAAPAPTPAPVAPAASGDPFGDPAPQAARGPRLREMYGRLVLITPKLVERVPARDEKARAQSHDGKVDRMTADVVILDGGPCAYGGEPEKPGGAPHDKVAQPPHRNRDMFISSAGLISQCRDALAKRQAGQPGMVLGRLRVGAAKQADYNPPWLLDPATDADKAIARAYLATIDVFG